MAKTYRVHAYEPATQKSRFLNPLSIHQSATNDAERWANEYYGNFESTWCKQDGADRILVGRKHADGRRDPMSCVITVEEQEAGVPNAIAGHQ